jgi:nicotinamidase-related amidase
MPAIQAQGEGYDVYAVTDASGGVSIQAHDMAIQRTGSSVREATFENAVGACPSTE